MIITWSGSCRRRKAPSLRSWPRLLSWRNLLRRSHLVDFDAFVWFWFWWLCLIVNAESLFTWDCRRGYRQVLLWPRNIWREEILKQSCVFIIFLPRQEHLWGFCEVKEETIFPDFSGWKEFYCQRTIPIRYLSNLKTRLTWWYRRKDVWPGHRCWG